MLGPVGVHRATLETVEGGPAAKEGRSLDLSGSVVDMREVEDVVVFGHRETSWGSTRERTTSSSPVPTSTG